MTKAFQRNAASRVFVSSQEERDSPAGSHCPARGCQPMLAFAKIEFLEFCRGMHQAQKIPCCSNRRGAESKTPEKVTCILAPVLSDDSPQQKTTAVSFLGITLRVPAPHLRPPLPRPPLAHPLPLPRPPHDSQPWWKAAWTGALSPQRRGRVVAATAQAEEQHRRPPPILVILRRIAQAVCSMAYKSKREWAKKGGRRGG